MKELIYPVTIIQDRYNGVYSGAKWTAWNLEADEVPEEISSDDTTCHNFWALDSQRFLIGKGNTPNDAVENLMNNASLPPDMRAKTWREKLSDEIKDFGWK